jgi:hypothetical protein
MDKELLVFVTIHGGALLVLLVVVLGGPPIWSLM